MEVVCINGALYVPPLPTSLIELAVRLLRAAAAVTPTMFTDVLTEHEYSLLYGGLLKVSLVNVCKLFSVGHKNMVI
jgi:hypothetical protein